MNAVKRRSSLDLAFMVLLATSPCLSAMAQQIDPATYQRVVDENIELRQEQTRLTKENSDLRRRNADLILDIQDQESKREQLALLVSQLKTPEESKAELDRLRAERVALMNELERVRQSLVVVVPASTNTPPPLPSPEQGSSLFRKIEQENADLRQQLERERETLQAKTKAHDAVTAQATEYLAKVEKLSKELGDLNQDLDKARSREASLRKALDKIARQSFQQQEEIARLQAENAKLEGEKDRAGTLPTSGGVGPSVQTRDDAPVSREDLGGLLAAAQSALKARRSREAEKLYGEALKKAPKDPRVHYNLGVLYSDYLKNPDKAAQSFRRYLELAPAARDAPQVRSWLIDLEVQAGR